MQTPDLYYQILSLSPEQQQEVADFVAFLKSQSPALPRLKERQFGFAKGAFEMAPDFDAPLEDFKDYM